MRRAPVSRRNPSTDPSGPSAKPARARLGKHDAELASLKRSVVRLARVEGEPMHLAEGRFLVRARGLKTDGAGLLVRRLRETGRLDRATLEAAVVLEAPPEAVGATLVATASRDLGVLDRPDVLALVREHRRVFGRHRVDEAWLARKRAAIARLQESDTAGPADWFDDIIVLVRVLRGEAESIRAARAAQRIRARGTERRREARERVAEVVRALESGAAHPLAERLDAARDLPGRARRRRVLEVLREIVRWPDAPMELVRGVGTPTPPVDYAAKIAAAGEVFAASLPVLRDPAVREASLALLAPLVLVFPLGGDDVPRIEPHEVNLRELLALGDTGLDLARALQVYRLLPKLHRARIGRWVAEGLSLDLVREVVAQKLGSELARVPDLRAARAYATWATRLKTHYGAQGIAFSLSPELFSNLPARGEDLAVLAMCLLEQADPKMTTAQADPVAILDATLALFQKLPRKAENVLARLRGGASGVGRATFPELAGWLGDDELLDRCIHLEVLAGEPHLSSAIREDFEHAARTGGERAYLETLASPSLPQQGRLDALRREERTLAGSPKGRTRRRIADRIERILPLAYRRELDGAFREILREVWGIAVPSLTPAWRDAVRFWLVVDDNRDLLGHLLRDAADGRDPKLRTASSRAWIARATFDVAAWLAPRAEPLVIDGKRFVVALEEDPLEVLRMGIPFATCLSLEDGCNAASTVLNAIDPNKRVVYVRNEAGNVVARKLLAVTKENRLVGYNLYVSVDGDAETKVRAAVLALVRGLAADAGLTLAAAGEPEKVHDGFWYDDGPVAFEEEADVSAYCNHLDLAPPARVTADLRREAHRWLVCERGLVDDAIAATSYWGDQPSERALGAWVVERLGKRAAERLDEGGVFLALLRTVRDLDGTLRAFDLLGRNADSYRIANRLAPLVLPFPPSPKIANAVLELGLRALRGRPWKDDLGHQVLRVLPSTFDTIAGGFDLLDASAPIAAHVLEGGPACRACVDDAVTAAVEALERLYARNPEPAVVIAALVSARRSEATHRAALFIAARHVLPDGARAVDRFRKHRPVLAATAHGAAARLRQTQAEVVDDGSSALERGVLADHLDDEATRAFLTQRSSFEPSAELTVTLWQRTALRTALAHRIAERWNEEWSLRVKAFEREAAARGLDVDGLFEAVALARAVDDDAAVATEVATPEELHTTLGIVLREAAPATAVKVYDSLGDARSASVFLRAFRRQPPARQAAIREAATKLDLARERRRTFFPWLLTSAREDGRLRRALASSIEPE